MALSEAERKELENIAWDAVRRHISYSRLNGVRGKIDAIKEFRTRTNLGLRESKGWIEAGVVRLLREALDQARADLRHTQDQENKRISVAQALARANVKWVDPNCGHIREADAWGTACSQCAVKHTPATDAALARLRQQLQFPYSQRVDELRNLPAHNRKLPLIKAYREAHSTQKMGLVEAKIRVEEFLDDNRDEELFRAIADAEMVKAMPNVTEKLNDMLG